MSRSVAGAAGNSLTGNWKSKRRSPLPSPLKGCSHIVLPALVILTKAGVPAGSESLINTRPCRFSSVNTDSAVTTLTTLKSGGGTSLPKPTVKIGVLAAFIVEANSSGDPGPLC